MSNWSAENPDSDPIVLRRIVNGGDSRIRVNITTNSGRAPSGSSTTTLGERARWVVIILMAIGLGETVYGVHAARSSLAAAPVYRASASCRLPVIDSAAAAASAVCRTEPAVIVARTL